MKQLNRHILKLLMLFVGLFAISNVGWSAIYFHKNENNSWTNSRQGQVTSVGQIFYVTGQYNDYNAYFVFENGTAMTPTWGENTIGYSTGLDVTGTDQSGKTNITATKGKKEAFFVWKGAYKVIIKSFNESSGSVTFDVEPVYYLNGDYNNWGDGTRFEGSGKTLTATITEYNGGNEGFKISGPFYYWAGVSSGSINKSGDTNYWNGTSEAKCVLPSAANGCDVKFTLTLDSNNKPSSLKVEWQKIIYFFSNQGVNFDENITTEWGKAYEIELDANNKGSFGPVYVDDGHYLLFSTSNQLKANNGKNQVDWSTVFRPNGSSDDEKVYPNQETTGYYNRSGNEKSFKMPGGTFMIEVTSYTKDNQVKFKLVPYQQFTTNKDLAGRYFLVGNQINNNTPSPAWELVRDGNSYKLDNFAMRYSNDIGVVYYNSNGTPTYIACNVSNMPEKEKGGASKDGYYSQVGWTYSATFSPNNTTNPTSGTLTFNNGSTFNINNNILPYIGVLGYSFVQQTQRNTLLGNTSSGWQEAYIEYNSDGYPELKSDGSAYYNTVWPPKNNILMQANIGTDPLNVSSKDLTMVPVGTMSGTQWATTLTGDDYANLRSELNGKSTQYTRYVVRNVWMQGEFKLWTGWAGLKASWGANWDTHFYWGPTQQGITDWVTTGGQTNGVLPVNFNTVYSTSNDNWDKNAAQHANANLNFGTLRKNNTYSRAYYKTMELFIPKDDSSGDVYNFLGSKLYLTQAPGGAQIDAIGRQNGDERKAYYAPSLTYFPTGYHVSSYRVTRYAYEASANSDYYDTELDPCSPERKKVSYTNAKVVGESTGLGTTIKSNDDFVNKFNNDLEGYTLDQAGIYDPGRYIFRLEVTFANDDDPSKTMKADEWSPYIEFIGDFKIGLEAYQLVELPKTDNPFSGYTHITYDEENNYKLVSYDGSIVSKYEDIPEDTEESVITDIYNNTGKWTNKVLLASQIPSSYYSTGVSRRIDGFYIGNDIPDNQLKRLGTDYLKVVDQSTSFTNETYTAQFDASFILANEESYKTIQQATNKQGAITASANYKPYLPSPRVKEARVEVYYGTDNSEDTDNATKEFYFEGVNGPIKLESARYQNVKEIVEVDLPNVTDELKSTMGDIFTYYFQKTGSKVTNPKEVIILNDEGKLPTTAVVPSTLFSSKNEDATGNDIWDYKILGFESTHNNIYDRGWNSLDDGMITSIKLETKKPLDDDVKANKSNIMVSNSMVESIIVNGEDHLVGSFDLYIDMDADNEAYIDHEDKGEDDMLHGNLDNDYYYFTVYDRNKPQEKDDYVLASTLTTGGVDSSKTGTISGAEFAVTVKDINSTDGNGGHTVKICIDYGKMSEIGYSWDKIKPYYDKFINDRKNFEIRVSYLYPFFVPSAPKIINGKSRMAAQLSGSVIKSEATKWDLATEADVDSGVVTGLEGIGYDNAGSIRAGHGFIEVEGQSVAIYNASGICIATAEGRYDVAPGVYVVRLNGATSKVLVK